MTEVFGGVIENGVHRLPVRVYYEDTDAGGIVYYANYLKFVERGRSDFLRLLGIDQRAMLDAAEPLFFVVRRCEVDYFRPARFDDVLTVTTRLVDLRAASLTMAQEVRRGDERLVSATIQAAAIGANGGPRRFPPDLRHIFNMLLCSDLPPLGSSKAEGQVNR